LDDKVKGAQGKIDFFLRGLTMKSQIKKKVLRTSLFTVALAVVGLVTGTAGTATAKSLYVLADIIPG